MESVESGCEYTGLLQRQWTIHQAGNGEGVTRQAPSKVALSSYRSAVHRVAEEICVAPIPDINQCLAQARLDPPLFRQLDVIAYLASCFPDDPRYTPQEFQGLLSSVGERLATEAVSAACGG